MTVRHDIHSKDLEGTARLEALARKCRLDAEDEVRALSVYQGMIDAIADRVASRDREPSAPPATVYIAAYQHRFGVDLSAHASRDHAETRLLSIAWQQCMRDAEIRAAVDARFGPLVSQEPPMEPPFDADLHSGDEGTDGDSGSELVTTLPSRPIETAMPPGGEDARSRDDAEDRHQRRRRTFCEKLLEEWPDFVRGEALWIVECVVEQENTAVRWQDATADDDSQRGVGDGEWSS